jgi:hypothetical protein
MFIQDPVSRLFSIPNPEVKKHWIPVKGKEFCGVTKNIPDSGIQLVSELRPVQALNFLLAYYAQLHARRVEFCQSRDQKHS